MSIMQCPSGFKSVNCAVTRKTCLIKSNSFFSGQVISSRNTQFVHKRRVPLITRMGFGEDLINSITVFINNSPLADGKKALAIAQVSLKSQPLHFIKSSAIDTNSQTFWCRLATTMLKRLSSSWTPTSATIRYLSIPVGRLQCSAVFQYCPECTLQRYIFSGKKKLCGVCLLSFL